MKYEDRLISAKEAIDSVVFYFENEYLEHYDVEDIEYALLKTVPLIIDDTPDGVVYCKRCKFRKPQDFYVNDTEHKTQWCFKTWFEVADDDYCSRGEDILWK